MQQLTTEICLTRAEASVVIVTYTRLGYRPLSVPEMFFPDEQRVAEVWLRRGQSVEEVLRYHYGSQFKNLKIHCED